MQGVYAIIDSKDRVYYVGQSIKLETRAQTHLNAIQQGYSKKEDKLYWILGNMWYNDIMNLKLIILKEWKDNEQINLLDEEGRLIRELSPVLNTKVPKGCISFIKEINSVGDAIKQAEINKKYKFDKCRVIWAVKGAREMGLQSKNCKELWEKEV